MSADGAEHRPAEAGQVTAFVVIFTVAVLFVAGLVLDGGAILAAKRQAINEAEEAARAAVQQVDEDALRGSGRFVVDRRLAEAVVADYLAATGHAGRVVAVRTDTAEVTVEVEIRRDLLLLPGDGVTVTGTGTARNARGTAAADD